MCLYLTLSWQRIHLQCRIPLFDSWVRKIPWRRVTTPVFLAFPGDSDGKESACSVGALGFIPGVGSPGGGHGNPLLAWRIPKDRGAYWATGHGIAKSQT